MRQGALILRGSILGVLSSMCAFALLPVVVCAQVPSDAMFDPSQLREVRVTIAPEDWTDLVNNPDPDESGDTRVYRCVFEWNGESLANVGIRAKGQGSRERESPKPGVRFLFNRYEGERMEGGDLRPEQSFRGLKKLDANSLRGDPSMMRDRLIQNAASRYNLVSPRTMHVRFYVNGAYVGLYLIVDNYDQAAVLRRLFQRRDGNLYKYTWTRDRGADDATRWRGEDPETYVGPNGVFAWKRRRTERPDDLIDLLRAINLTTDAEFESRIPLLLDLDNLLSYCALCQVTANGDWMFVDTGEGPGTNNWWWYAQPSRDGESPPVFHVLIWDVDSSMVDFLPAELWIPRDIFRGFDLHVLPRRVMGVPAWREAYLARVQAFIDGAFAPSTVQADIDSIRAQILQAAQEDRNKPYTDAEFEASITLLRRDVPLRVENVRGQLAR